MAKRLFLPPGSSARERTLPAQWRYVNQPKSSRTLKAKALRRVSRRKRK